MKDVDERLGSSSATLVSAMRILANDIQSDDGVANAAIREAADRIEQLEAKLRQAHKDYGCEIRDPCGTIWEYCDLMRSKAIDVLEWYHRDGSVGGACDPMEALREVVGVTEEWLCRVVLPRRWDDIPRGEQKSCYWAAIPNDPDNILDGMEYEIVYVYFDGKWSVMRPGESQREPLSAFRFICPIDSFEIREA
jgi:hypothetical protein